LLDADKAYKHRYTQSYANKSIDEMEGVLSPADQELFNRLISHKMLELNLGTTLTAKFGWTPRKSPMGVGLLVHYRSCNFQRSVTKMAPNGLCGLCATTDFTVEQRHKRTSNRVSKNDDQNTTAIWVECSMRSCRVQYVLYNPHELNVRLKCFYCRTQPLLQANDASGAIVSKAPYVEYTVCLNRMIWPEEYRNGTMKKFKYMACTDNQKSIIDIEPSAASLSQENGTDWLLEIRNGKIQDPFNGRSLFYIISTVGTMSFCDDVLIFPQKNRNPTFLLNGKPIHDAENVFMQLIGWVEERRGESGTCSLCFNSSRKSLLLPACGRSACSQRICKDCLQGWYGLNAPGRIINTSALACPLCRLAPAAKTFANLRTAIEKSGKWIHVWCSRCAYEKAYIERSCVAGEIYVENWSCEDCSTLIDELEVKECPRCGVLTEKTLGCNHSQCGILACQTHWCFFCGEASTEDMIYQHMDMEHGGYYS
jgi:hypothetical protein